MKNLPLPPPADFANLTFSAAIEWLFNQAIRLDEDLGQGFAPLDEKVIQLTITDLKQTFFLIYQQDEHGSNGFTVQQHLMGAPDTSIKGAFADFIGLKNTLNYDDFDITGSETLGSETLGQAFLTAVHQLEPDWEEHLSHFTGDLIAHQVGATVRQVRRTAKEVKQQAKMTLKEYLQFEINLVPTKHQVNAFNQEVDRLEERTRQLEEKINALVTE